VLKDGALYIVLFNTTHSVQKPRVGGGRRRERKRKREREKGGGECFTSELALTLLYTEFICKNTLGLISVAANNAFIIRNGKTLQQSFQQVCPTLKFRNKCM
jgi:hypothetical protein